MLFAAPALLGIALTVQTMVPPAEGPLSRPLSVRGTVSHINQPALRLTLQIEGGQAERLTIANIDALRAVQQGDRVHLELDAHGIVLNANKIAPAPLLPLPLPQG